MCMVYDGIAWHGMVWNVCIMCMVCGGMAWYDMYGLVCMYDVYGM